MNLVDPSTKRVLTLDPTSQGLGFAVLEGPTLLIDWGGRTTASANAAAVVEQVTDMLRHYRIDVLVVEDCTDLRSRRGRRACALIEALSHAADEMGIVSIRISITAVHRLFGGDEPTNKDEIARAIAEHFPELAPRLPPKRKVWMTEPTRMAIFDAVAFGLTYYYESSGAVSPSAINDYDGRLHDASAARHHRGNDRDGYEKDK